MEFSVIFVCVWGIIIAFDSSDRRPTWHSKQNTSNYWENNLLIRWFRESNEFREMKINIIVNQIILSK